MPVDWFPLTLSLRVAALSTAISLVAGIAIAYGLANFRFRGREIVDAAVSLPRPQSMGSTRTSTARRSAPPPT